MKFQQTNYSCGPAALLNAFRSLGAKQLPSERITRKLALCHKDTGTDCYDLAAAVTLLGFRVAQTTCPQDVEYYLKQGCPVMVVAYEDSHWIAVVGMLGDRWVVVDSDNSRRNKAENGCYVMAPEDLQSLTYEGIAILGRHPALAKAKRKPRLDTPKLPSRRSSSSRRT